MPDSSGRFKGISIPRVPWHEGSLFHQTVLKMQTQEYLGGNISPSKALCVDGEGVGTCVGCECPQRGSCDASGVCACQVDPTEEACRAFELEMRRDEE